MEAGKTVATSNKELVAKYGAELMRIAEEKQINFLFEASVGGGIPIIRPLNQCITSDEVYEITGILNGTTNYMLTNMAKKGMTFDAILKKAQELGYAERHPEADIEGFDACRKIAILSSLAFGAQVDYEDIHTEGITTISDIDIKYALKLEKAIKLFGTSKKIENKIYAMVSPVMIGEEHPLYSVNGVMNGILVRGDVIGDLMFYGAGAGKLPTASAVVADVVEAAKNLNRTVMRRWSEKKLGLEPFDPRVMKKPPRKPDEHIFSNGLGFRIMMSGILIGLTTLGSFLCVYRMTGDVTHARTAALFALIFAQLIHVFECKT